MEHMSATLTPDNVKFGKDLLDKLKKGLITMVEFEKEIIYFALMCGFDELKPQPLPTRPISMLRFDSLTLKDKQAINENFWQQEDVKKYLIQKTMILNSNKVTESWLKELQQKLINYNDNPNAEKIKSRLSLFLPTTAKAMP